MNTIIPSFWALKKRAFFKSQRILLEHFIAFGGDAPNLWLPYDATSNGSGSRNSHRRACGAPSKPTSLSVMYIVSIPLSITFV